MWDVPVTADEAARLRTRAWDARGVDPFVRRLMAGDGRPFRIRRDAGGRCFFLAADNRCRIHSEISYDAKPEACKAFPLSLSDVGSTRHVRLSFWCPTVAADRGALITDQMRWVK